jgi:hypothetical protein
MTAETAADYARANGTGCAKSLNGRLDRRSRDRVEVAQTRVRAVEQAPTASSSPCSSRRDRGLPAPPCSRESRSAALSSPAQSAKRAGRANRFVRQATGSRRASRVGQVRVRAESRLRRDQTSLGIAPPQAQLRRRGPLPRHRAFDLSDAPTTDTPAAASSAATPREKARQPPIHGHSSPIAKRSCSPRSTASTSIQPSALAVARTLTPASIATGSETLVVVSELPDRVDAARSKRQRSVKRHQRP